MALQILKRKSAEMAFTAEGGTIRGGRLVGYEVRERKGDYLVYKHTCNQHNWMFQRLGNRICNNWGASSWQTIEGEFSACQIGTSDTANSENITNTVAPISGIGRTTAIYSTANQSYNFSRFDILTPAVFGSTSVDGDYRITYRVSHQHTALPSTAASSVIIKEITYTNAASPATSGGGPYSAQLINSRVVLQQADQIELQPDQYVITIYEWQYRLPSFREVAFSDSDIQVTGLVPSSGDKAGRVRLAGALPADGAQFANGTYIYMPWRTAMSSMLISTAGSLASGGNSSGISYASRLGVARNTTFLGIGSGKTNWSSNDNSINTGTNDMYVDVSATNPGGYQYDLIRTQTFTRARRAEGVVLEDMPNVRSLFVFWYQFLFDNLWSLYSDQQFEITAKLKWNILNAI